MESEELIQKAPSGARGLTATSPVRAHGARIPVLGFGTWQLTGGDARRMVEYALEVGYRHVDTAQAYENEDEVGRALEASDVPREEIWLTTKVWPEHYRPDAFRSSVLRSLERLRVESVDLLLLHWPAFRGTSLEATVELLQEAREEGRARHVGLSNFTTGLMTRAWASSRGPLAVNQVEYHPFLDQGPVLESVRDRHMALIAYSPVAQGRVGESPALAEIAEKHGKSEEQVALRWLVQQESVCAIPRTSKEEHCRENFRIFDFSLTENEMERIGGLPRPDGRIIEPEGLAPEWD